jgi:flagellar protein FliJ
MSKRFKFRLASLQKLRELTRDSRQADLAEAEQARAILQRQIEQLGKKRDDLLRESSEAVAPGEVNIDYLRWWQNHAEAIESRRDRLDQQNRQLVVECQSRRESLIEANRAVKVLEKLCQKRRNEHDQKEDRSDRQWMDEVALLQTFRQREEVA